MARLDEVMRAPAPAAQLGDQDSIDLVGPGQWQNFGALGARIVSTRRRLLEYDLVAGTLGERPQVPFLALARLIVGRDAAVDGPLSQLNPRDFACEMPAFSGQIVLQSVVAAARITLIFARAIATNEWPSLESQHPHHDGDFDFTAADWVTWPTKV
jgi:hypothetical protein